jgi:hypothetical protein
MMEDMQVRNLSLHTTQSDWLSFVAGFENSLPVNGPDWNVRIDPQHPEKSQEMLMHVNHLGKKIRYAAVLKFNYGYHS